MNNNVETELQSVADERDCDLKTVKTMSGGTAEKSVGVSETAKNMPETADKAERKKLRLPAEVAYLLANVFMALAVAILTSADFGLSMIVSPAYLLSVKLGFVTFGQAEYIIQAVAFVILCIVLRRFRFVYLVSFLTCLIYGLILDLWRLLPCFNTTLTPPESIPLPLRIAMFVFGMLLTSFAVALHFKTYIYPQVYDFFVQAVTKRYNLKLSIFKTAFDMAFLAIGSAMTLVFFGKFVGLNWGTLVMALLNGTVIGFFSKFLDAHFTFPPLFKSFAERFRI